MKQLKLEFIPSKVNMILIYSPLLQSYQLPQSPRIILWIFWIIDSASVSAVADNFLPEVKSPGLFEIIETKKQENTMMDHNGQWDELYFCKDPVSPKCSPYGPLTDPWSPGSPSSSSLSGFHEGSETTYSTIEEVLNISYYLRSWDRVLWYTVLYEAPSSENFHQHLYIYRLSKMNSLRIGMK